LEIIVKAIIVKAPGGLDRFERITLPDPGPPGPGAIRVRLHASSLNFHDYGVVSTPNRVSDGRIPMSDGAGLVEAVGEGVKEFEVNDHVVSCFFPTWTEGAPTVGDFSTVPGDGVDGYAREIVVAPATAFTRAQKRYSFAEAATLTTAGVTAWRALAVNGALKAGDTVLVLGTGGVSIFALQLQRPWGPPSSRHRPPTLNWSEPAASAPITPSTIVIILIGGRGSWIGPEVLAWITSSR
jgi:NADPH:quinone reductase-like Zn-dependent oxidoreductase